MWEQVTTGFGFTLTTGFGLTILVGCQFLLLFGFTSESTNFGSVWTCFTIVSVENIVIFWYVQPWKIHELQITCKPKCMVSDNIHTPTWMFFLV